MSWPRWPWGHDGEGKPTTERETRLIEALKAAEHEHDLLVLALEARIVARNGDRKRRVK